MLDSSALIGGNVLKKEISLLIPGSPYAESLPALYRSHSLLILPPSERD